MERLGRIQMDVPLGKGDRNTGLAKLPINRHVKFVQDRQAVPQFTDEHAQVEIEAVVAEALKEGKGRRVLAPGGYELTLSEVTRSSYRAQVTHKASGLSCKLEVGTGGGSENPTCE